MLGAHEMTMRRRRGLRAVVAGHVWTVLPHLRAQLGTLVSGDPQGVERPWSTRVVDPQVGSVRLTGRLRTREGADTIAIVIHGLGGSAESGYCLAMEQAITSAGWSSLRVNLRGADRLGGDLYHAGLASDLAAIVGSEALAGYRRVFLIGFSLGGHAALWHGLDPDPRVAGITAICAPMDLAASAASLDQPRSLLYRLHVLRELKKSYRQVARRGDVPTEPHVVDRVTTIRDWDAATVVPRFGFANVEDYWAKASVGPRLSGLRAPALYVGAPADPMVPMATVRPSLDAAGTVQERWLEGAGHVGFPEPAIWPRLVSWTSELELSPSPRH